MKLITEKDFDLSGDWSVVTKENVVMSRGFIGREEAEKFIKTAYLGYYSDCVASPPIKTENKLQTL